MLKKVLVANRGEIAVRVIRTCRELGVATVAVYSELDRDALHVRLADEAYALGGQTTAESYLATRRDPCCPAAKRAPTPYTPATGSSPRTPPSPGPWPPPPAATFIGPPPAAMEVMGDKISARLAAARAGVAAVPGRSEPILEGPGEIIAFGEEHGWPVAIKAAFGGGGGRGMRVVTAAGDTAEAMESRSVKLGVDLRAPGGLRRAVPGLAPSCRDAGLRRPPRQRRSGSGSGTARASGATRSSSRRALLPNSPTTCARRWARRRYRSAGACGSGKAQEQSRNSCTRTGSFYFLEMNARLAGRAPRHRADDRARSRRVAAADRRGRGDPPCQQDEIAAQSARARHRGRMIQEVHFGGEVAPQPWGRSRPFGFPTGLRRAVRLRVDRATPSPSTTTTSFAKIIAWGDDRDAGPPAFDPGPVGEMEVEGIASHNTAFRPSSRIPSSSRPATRPVGSRSASTCRAVAVGSPGRQPSPTTA